MLESGVPAAYDLHLEQAIRRRTEWIKLMGSVPGLYPFASLPAAYPRGFIPQKRSQSKELIVFFGVDEMGQCIKKCRINAPILSTW